MSEFSNPIIAAPHEVSFNGSRVKLKGNSDSWREAFNLVEPTLSELKAKLKPNHPSFEIYNLQKPSHEQDLREYGVYVFSKELVTHLPPRDVYRLGTLLSHGNLVSDWGFANFQQYFDKTSKYTFSVVGASVGSTIFTALNRAARPEAAGISDLKSATTSNLNRLSVPFAARETNKAVHAAKVVSQEYPFTKLNVDTQGITSANAVSFFENCRIIFEECDNVGAKIDVRVAARDMGIPVVMITDLAHRSMVDIRRFDVDDSQSLVLGVPDQKILDLREKVYNGDQNARMELTLALVGGPQNVPPSLLSSLGPDGIINGFPQNGATVMYGGALAPKFMFDILHGVTNSERSIFDPFKGLISQSGDIV